MAPQPYNPAQAESIDFRTDIDLSGNGLLWYSRPQLFFQCTARRCAPPAPFILPGRTRNLCLALVFFSTLESFTFKLTPDAVKQRNGVHMLYDAASSSNLPSLHLCLARNVLGRAPLKPCFVRGNRTHEKKIANKILFFANFVAFSPSGVSFSPSGVSYSPVSTFASLWQSS